MTTSEYVKNILATAATNEDKAECLALEIAWLTDKQEMNSSSLKECIKMADEAMAEYNDLKADLLQGLGSFSKVKEAYLHACWLAEQVSNYQEEVIYIGNALADCQKELSQLFDLLELDWLLA